MECGSYRGIKLLEHAMKVVERIFEHRIRQQIEVDDMQFRFMKGKGTTDAIFTVKQMQEHFRVKGKKLYFGFVDLLVGSAGRNRSSKTQWTRTEHCKLFSSKATDELQVDQLRLE